MTTQGQEASWLHGAVESAFNAGDLDALVALYVDDACMINEDGSVARGRDAIREVWQGFVSMGGKVTMKTRYCVESGDTALLSNTWEFTSPDATFSSATAEVAVRGADGTWRYVIDNPTGGTDAAPA
jgi:uncharacterized protein (TIGR02246 family)